VLGLHGACTVVTMALASRHLWALSYVGACITQLNPCILVWLSPSSLSALLSALLPQADVAAKVAISGLKHKFMTAAEALLHGDLHTGENKFNIWQAALQVHAHGAGCSFRSSSASAQAGSLSPGLVAAWLQHCLPGEARDQLMHMACHDIWDASMSYT
jgi:hypothetical protein